MRTVIVSGSFDDMRSRHIRFLEEASKLGRVHVLLWSDETVQAMAGKPPRFPQEERHYLLQAVRYVNEVSLFTGRDEKDMASYLDRVRPDIWAVDTTGDGAWKRACGEAHGVSYRVLSESHLEGFPLLPVDPSEMGSSRKKVIVTGCYDWFHSGHVRFFEEVSELGDLVVVVGHDRNVRLLKGEGHPMFSQDERRYMAQAIRTVKQALVSSGEGWMDAAPEIDRIKPDIYAVNEDGDKPEKRAFCKTHGLDYVVLKRAPKEGLPRRESTNLRGF